MSVINGLIQGFDATCIDVVKKYYQNIVLVNKKDVEYFKVITDETRNQIYFNLKTGKTGYLFAAPESGTSMTANWSKTEQEGIPLYTHNAAVPIVGVKEAVKALLKQLDQSNYFAATHFKDGSIEIHGFNYGLKTSDYDFQGQGLGGSIIPLTSRELEYDPPYIYWPKISYGGRSTAEQAIEDFNNLFADIVNIDTGDFNDDFNDDFLIL